MRAPILIREVMRGFLSALSLLSLGLLWAQGFKEPLFRVLSQRPDNPRAAPVKEAVFLELNRPLFGSHLKDRSSHSGISYSALFYSAGCSESEPDSNTNAGLFRSDQRWKSGALPARALLSGRDKGGDSLLSSF
jgi:hypothetical protein